MDPDARPPSAAPASEAVEPAATQPSVTNDQTSDVDASTAKPVTGDVASESARSDVPKFRSPLVFGQKAVAFSRPHHSQDLIGLYNVTPTAAKVARTDPYTGEKINKLRSSYQNHIKAFQIAGRNKPIRHENSLNGMSLREIAAWPEEEWRNQKVATKEVSKGLSSSALARLERAVKLEPGPVPKNDEWENILGHEKTKPGGPASPAPDGDGRQLSHATKASKTNGQSNGAVPSTADGEAIRARRTGKRRRYDDESFEGYGEGYVDDDRDDADGYSSGEGTKKRKRRKDLGAVNSPDVSGYGLGVQQSSIGRGIGAFGGR